MNSHRSVKQAKQTQKIQVEQILDNAEGCGFTHKWDYGIQYDLQDILIHTKSFPFPQARYLIYQIAQSFKFVHDRGYAIRGFKTDDIRFDEEYNPKIYRRWKYTECKDGFRVAGYLGTQIYMAPELSKDLPYFTPIDSNDLPATDVFSLGIVVFVILFSQYPIQSSQLKDNPYLQLIQEKNWTQFWKEQQKEDINDSVKQMIQSLIAFDADERWTLDEFLNCEWMQNGEMCQKYQFKQFIEERVLQMRKDKYKRVF